MFRPCTTPMYINNVPKDIIHEMYPPCANINYAKHVHLPICQPCASTNMPTNVHLPIIRYTIHVHHHIILHNPIDEHLNLQQIVLEPATNNVRPCNRVIPSHQTPSHVHFLFPKALQQTNNLLHK